MKIEKLVSRLQELAAERPGAEVVVGLDMREPCENAIEAVDLVQEDPEDEGSALRVVIFAPS